MSEEAGQIAWRPSPEMLERANLTQFMRRYGFADYADLNRRANADPGWFWDLLIRHFELGFSKPYSKILDLERGPEWARWCIGGETNIAVNCLEKHLIGAGQRRHAVVWEGEDGALRTWTVAELDAAASRLAHALAKAGVGAGDAVAIYMPMLPETAAAFFAVLKLGAIALPLFSGFGPEACRTRLQDAGAKAAITVDATLRRGKPVAMKAILDEAAKDVPSLKCVLVVERLKQAVGLQAGRDQWWHEALAGQPTSFPARAMPAEAPAVLVFTSGTTGRPKGTVLSHCGFMAKVALDFGLILDFKAADRLFWMSDMGWLTGPILLVATQLLGGTLIMAEGAPDYPKPDRMWRIIEEQHVSFFGIAPTAARAQMQHGTAALKARDLSSIRVIGSTGEPWNPDSWLWVFHNVGGGRAPILNYTGGTEIGGGIAAATVIHPQKPCCFAGSIPGMAADVVDETGRTVAPGQVGELVMRQPSIGLTRGLWKDPERYLDTYWRHIPGLWVHGDFASIDADGFWFVHGRSDDTIKVSGKRTGPAEIEAIVHAMGRIAEAAAVGVPDEIKGQAVVCACVAGSGEQPGAALAEAVAKAVVQGMGSSFRPKRIVFVSDLPKTRNMKVMRRLVRSAYLGQPPGDLTALVNPEVVEELKARFAET
ncbi:MAG: AMP-binding protein [Alphaproteobacteria bacterium]|nr:AMP-binding protein [Alphaproteobacteria bacterium]